MDSTTLSPDHARERLAASLKHMVDEADELLKSAQGAGSDKFAAARDKFETQLRHARDGHQRRHRAAAGLADRAALVAHGLDTNPGPLAALRAVLAGLLQVGRTRLQLAGTEIEEERLRLAELLLWATFALFFVGVGVVLAALLLVLLAWNGPREWVLAGLVALFLAVGAWATHTWRRKARDKPPFLAATIGELARDRAALAGHER